MSPSTDGSTFQPVASLVGEPSLGSATFFGGGGDQAGLAIAIGGSGIYLAGYDPASGANAIVSYGTPPGSPAWATTLPGAPGSLFLGLAVSGTTLYGVGYANPPLCGAGDGVGGTEGKTLLARFNPAGTLLGCGSQNIFPYTGWEYYNTVTAVVEGGSAFAYAAGQAEQLGFGASFPFILTRYDAGGSIVDQVTEPGITLGSYTGCCPGESNVIGLAAYGPSIYLAGYSRLTGFGEDGVYRPALMRYGTTPLARVWKERPTDNPGGLFRAVTALGGYLYAVGNVNGFGGPGTDYLVEKYDDGGVRIWSVTSGGGDEDVLTGVVAVGGRLFAVGHTRSSGAGGSDAVMLEIDPATGATLSTTLFGGALDDQANGAATDGTDLYVVGESRSFASGEGNAIGQNDMMLLRYTLVMTVAIDIKPGQATNSINPTSKGNTPVAILSTADFDAVSQVDRTSLTFGRTGAEASFAFCGSVPSDVNGDGRVDLVCQFVTRKTGFQTGDTEGILKGKTEGGTAIEGRDAVRVIP